MTVHDACPTRTEDRVHSAIRTLLDRMKIVVVEPRSTRKNSVLDAGFTRRRAWPPARS
jgi:hypothetical protein